MAKMKITIAPHHIILLVATLLMPLAFPGTPVPLAQTNSDHSRPKAPAYPPRSHCQIGGKA
jgi:hypothetical protein